MCLLPDHIFLAKGVIEIYDFWVQDLAAREETGEAEFNSSSLLLPF
jgi:hypothetical protein